VKTTAWKMLVGTMALCLHSIGGFAQDDGTSFEDVRREASELMSSIGDYSAEQRDEAVAATQRTLEKMDRSIEEMEQEMREQWDSMDDAAREQSREAMEALRRERTELAEWYGAMKNSTSGAWDEMKVGFSESLESMSEAWDRAVKKFEE